MSSKFFSDLKPHSCYLNRYHLFFLLETRRSINSKLNIPSFIICWFKEFLNNRHLVVKIGSTLSQINKITAGVPKGAATSPILFSLYINDISLMHKRNKDYCLLFADDLISLNFFKKKGNIQRHINVYLNKVERLLKKMEANDGSTQVQLYHLFTKSSR
jgi:hypothetical protein